MERTDESHRLAPGTSLLHPEHGEGVMITASPNGSCVVRWRQSEEYVTLQQAHEFFRFHAEGCRLTLGAHVRHATRGDGLVVSIMPTGGRVVQYQSGDAHTYQVRSWSKLMTNAKNNLSPSTSFTFCCDTRGKLELHDRHAAASIPVASGVKRQIDSDPVPPPWWMFPKKRYGACATAAVALLLPIIILVIILASRSESSASEIVGYCSQPEAHQAPACNVEPLGIWKEWLPFHSLKSPACALRPGVWNEIRSEKSGDMVCQFGTPYVFFVNPGDPKKLIIEFSGGGACVDAETCLSPGKSDTASDTERFWYANNRELNIMLAPDVKAFGLDKIPGEGKDGISPRKKRNGIANPVEGWTHIFISYCTSDMHTGNKTVTHTYKDTAHPELPDLVMQHRGAANTVHVLNWVAANFNVQSVDQVLLTGCSAGSLGAAWWASHIMQMFHCSKVTLVADSGSFGAVAPFTLQAMKSSWGLDENGANPKEFALKYSRLSEYGSDLQQGMADAFIQTANQFPNNVMAYVIFNEDSILDAYAKTAGIVQTPDELQVRSDKIIARVHAGAKHSNVWGLAVRSRKLWLPVIMAYDEVHALYKKKYDDVLSKLHQWQREFLQLRPLCQSHCIIMNSMIVTDVLWHVPLEPSSPKSSASKCCAESTFHRWFTALMNGAPYNIGV